MTQGHQSFGHFVAAIFIALCASLTPSIATADVAHGSKEDAQKYYRAISTKLGFSTPDRIFSTTLDDVAAYFGYRGITGADMQNISSAVLMDPQRLLAPCTGACPDSLRNRDAVLAALGTTKINAGDILVTRFFAPKIMNIKDPEATRKTGWRKLVQLRARPGSDAQSHKIASGVILFNFFSEPGAKPFAPGDESVNTQVMLIPELSQIPKPDDRDSDADALYWLDYDRLSQSGLLAFALVASFDANELAPDTGGVQPYFVPDGCVACHGNNSRRSMVNYLDTDHWFDRLDNDFPALKAQGLAILFDAQTNDPNSPDFKAAFDVMRRFNVEAEAQAALAQPKHDEVLAGKKWLDLHASSDEHFPPIARVIGPAPQWSAADATEVKLLEDMNQYCFRCHGTVKFSVFNRQAVKDRHPNIIGRIQPDAAIGVRMPTDRDLPPDIRRNLIDHLP